MKLIPNGRIWIDTEAGAFLGYGRVQLLLKIKELGSLRKAAAEMKMSYQQAWKLIKQINERANEPIVVLQKGGKNGGFAHITPFGEIATIKFEEFNKAFQLFLNSYNEVQNTNI